ALADAALDDVLELDHAEELAVLGDRQRRAAGLRDLIGNAGELAHHFGADIADKLDDSIDRALADPGGADLHAAHAALRGEGNELALHFGDVAPAQAVLFLGEHDDGAAFRRFVSE